MSKFVEGKEYRWAECGLDPIMAVKRTPKCIWFKTMNGSSWRLKIRIDEDGNEYVVDSTAPKKWRGMYTCSSLWEA